MKIVVKNIKDGVFTYLVYLKTDDDILVSAEFATDESLDHIIDDLKDGDEDMKVFVEGATTEPKDSNEQPLVLVFYLDSELMGNPEIITPFVDAVNQSIADREANMMAFFLPTNGQERIECINPLLATPEENNRITQLIDEISTSFDIGQDRSHDDYDDVNIINVRDDD